MTALHSLDAAIRAAVEDVVAPLRLELADLRARVGAMPVKMVSRAECAGLLGLSEPTVDRYIKAGLIKATKVRRRVMVDPSSLPDARVLAARARHGMPVST